MTAHAAPMNEALPATGLSRWAQLAPYLPVCKKTWMRLVEAGRAPQPQRLTQRTTIWKNADIHAYLRDPLGFRIDAEPQSKECQR